MAGCNGGKPPVDPRRGQIGNNAKLNAKRGSNGMDWSPTKSSQHQDFRSQLSLPPGALQKRMTSRNFEVDKVGDPRSPGGLQRKTSSLSQLPEPDSRDSRSPKELTRLPSAGSQELTRLPSAGSLSGMPELEETPPGRRHLSTASSSRHDPRSPIIDPRSLPITNRERTTRPASPFARAVERQMLGSFQSCPNSPLLHQRSSKESRIATGLFGQVDALQLIGKLKKGCGLDTGPADGEETRPSTTSPKQWQSAAMDSPPKQWQSSTMELPLVSFGDDEGVSDDDEASKSPKVKFFHCQTATNFRESRQSRSVFSDDSSPGDDFSPGSPNSAPSDMAMRHTMSAMVAGPSSLLARRRGKLTSVKTSIPRVPLRKIVPLEEGQKIFDLYHWNEVLQEDGNGGKVVICRDKKADDGDFNFVMKIKSKKDLRGTRVEEDFRKAQLRLLNLPPHDGVLPLHDVFEDDGFYYVLMEKAKGGSLFSSLLDDFADGNMPEAAIRGLMREVLEAVAHCHKQGVLHRDIKPDNLVVQVGQDPTSPSGRFKKVKLIDFDLADAEWCPCSPTKEDGWYVGTLRHSAPESLTGKFSEQSDMYSVGTILYMLLTGNMPYKEELFEEGVCKAKSLTAIRDRMQQEQVDWSGSCWDSALLCRDFCRCLLAFNPTDRPASAEQALLDPWFAASLKS